MSPRLSLDLGQLRADVDHCSSVPSSTGKLGVLTRLRSMIIYSGQRSATWRHFSSSMDMSTIIFTLGFGTETACLLSHGVIAVAQKLPRLGLRVEQHLRRSPLPLRAAVMDERGISLEDILSSMSSIEGGGDEKQETEMLADILSFYGLGWDFESRHFKLYLMVHGLPNGLPNAMLQWRKRSLRVWVLILSTLKLNSTGSSA